MSIQEELDRLRLEIRDRDLQLIDQRAEIKRLQGLLDAALGVILHHGLEVEL
jgi:hypothetical protein